MTVGSGDAAADGVVVGVAVAVGVGAAGTVNENVPSMGWPSLETTRHTTVTAPDADPANAWVTTVPETVGAPSVSEVPVASVTWITLAPSESRMSAL